MEMIEIPQRIMTDPEAFTEFRELLELDHSSCAYYGDVKEARMAREHRKEADRRKLLRGKSPSFAV